jgi:hypothetical protein
VQLQSAAGWDDAGCGMSPGTWVTSHTHGGPGQAVSFDVACVSGMLPTHLTGDEGALGAMSFFECRLDGDACEGRTSRAA